MSGPLKGKTVRCELDAFTQKKWDHVDALKDYGVAFQRADPLERKRAAWDFVLDHCARVSGGTAAP